MKRGYSIIEMIIVLAVLAIMATYAWPLVSKPLAKLRLKSIAQKVVNDVAKTRIGAMQGGKQQKFHLLVPYNVDSICDDIVCYSNGDIDGGVITLQQDKLKVDVRVDRLTQSAKVGDCYTE